MTRNFKALGLALVAMFAMSAVLASTASAQFVSEGSPVTLTVSDEAMQKFQIKNGGTTVECNNIEIDDGTESGTELTSVQIEPTYSDCEDLFGQDVDIDENGCDYVFNLPKGSTNGSVNLECPTSTGIRITVGTLCTYEIDTQTSLGSITYKNKGTSTTREVELVPSVFGISSERTTNHFPFLCPGGTNEGVYTGVVEVTGESGSGHTGVTVD